MAVFSKHSILGRLLMLAAIMALACTLSCSALATPAYAAASPSNPVIKDSTTTWNRVTFGTWEGQPIEWRVLSVKDGKAMLLADSVLARKSISDGLGESWSGCALRSWLNGYDSSQNWSTTDYSNDSFIGAAFSEAERSDILVTTIQTAEGSYSDKVSLLSTKDATNRAYGFSGSYRAYEWAGAPTSVSSDSDTASWWLLPQNETNSACYVRGMSFFEYDGDLGVTPNYSDQIHGVRPVIWVNLSAEGLQDSTSISKPYNGPRGDISSASLKFSPSTPVLYNGRAVTPTVRIAWRGRGLVEGRDYTVSYTSPCVSVGTYTVLIKGLHPLTGTIQKTFSITGDLSKFKLMIDSNNGDEQDGYFTYNGKVQHPNVRIGGSKASIKATRALKKGVDYTLSYSTGCKKTWSISHHC